MKENKSEQKKYYELLKDYRQDADLPQGDIAKRLNIAQSTLSQYESHFRNLPMETFIELVKIYGVSADYILGLSDDPRIDRWKK